ncbi:MAG: hypothetical protein ABII07_05375 [Patescibacteria group bacterium]|nr:hypothetical protein [Patescibacteria group bacterium]
MPINWITGPDAPPDFPEKPGEDRMDWAGHAGLFGCGDSTTERPAKTTKEKVEVALQQ